MRAVEAARSPRLVYHDTWTQYEGDTPSDIVDVLFRLSHAGTGATFPEWWAYQQALWRRRYGLAIPDAHARNAHARMLAVLTKVGALIPGPRPT